MCVQSGAGNVMCRVAKKMVHAATAQAVMSWRMKVVQQTNSQRGEAVMRQVVLQNMIDELQLRLKLATQVRRSMMSEDVCRRRNVTCACATSSGCDVEENVHDTLCWGLMLMFCLGSLCVSLCACAVWGREHHAQCGQANGS